MSLPVVPVIGRFRLVYMVIASQEEGPGRGSLYMELTHIPSLLIPQTSLNGKAWLKFERCPEATQLVSFLSRSSETQWRPYQSGFRSIKANDYNSSGIRNDGCRRQVIINMALRLPIEILGRCGAFKPRLCTIEPRPEGFRLREIIAICVRSSFA